MVEVPTWQEKALSKGAVRTKRRSVLMIVPAPTESTDASIDVECPEDQEANRIGKNGRAAKGVSGCRSYSSTPAYISSPIKAPLVEPTNVGKPYSRSSQIVIEAQPYWSNTELLTCWCSLRREHLGDDFPLVPGGRRNQL